MFIVIYTYTKPLNEVDAVRDSHVSHYAKYRDADKMICGGRQTSLKGGICILRDIPLDEVQRHVNSDPYVTENVATVMVYEFNPTIMCRELQAN